MTWHNVKVPIRPTARIGFYGGTFDPPHNGHVDLVASALTELRLDHVVVCPNAYPHGKKPMFGAEERLALTERAMEQFGSYAVVVEDEMPWNLTSASPVCTYDTVKRLANGSRFPGTLRVEWFLLMGEDQADTFHEWSRYEELAALVTPVYMERPEGQPSSTKIRDYIINEEWHNVEAFVPGRVYEMLARLTPPE